MAQDEVLAKLKEHDKRFEEHDKRFDEHDKRFDRIDNTLANLVNKTAEHEIRMDQFVTKVEFSEFKNDITEKLDWLIVMFRKFDQELTTRGYQIDRLNTKVSGS